MAGISKAEREARAAARAEASEAPSMNDEPEAAAVDDGLIAVAKDGEVLRVHPTALKAHQHLGWKAV